MRITAVLVAAALLLGLSSTSQAVPSVSTAGLTFVSLNPANLDFTSASGAGTAADPIVLVETISGLDVNMEIRGLPNGGQGNVLEGFTRGFHLIKECLNNTGVDWLFFDHELQETFGVPSTDGDGLSFAQGSAGARPFTSNLLPVVVEIFEPRDFVNFSGGLVAPGQVVTFEYWITDNSPVDLFYLHQQPNRAPVPEPLTMSGLLMGLAGFGAYLRKRRAR